MTSRDFTVHFMPVRTNRSSNQSKSSDGVSDDDCDESDEGVSIATQSLISGGRSSRRTVKCKHWYSCNLCSVPKRILAITATVFFTAGLIIGLAIGRFLISYNQSVDSLYSESKCNSTVFTSNSVFVRTTSASPNTTHILSKTKTTVTATEDGFSTLKSTTSSTVDISETTEQLSKQSSGCTFCKTRNPDKTYGDESVKSLFAPLTMNEMRKVEISLRTKGLASFGHNLQDMRISHVYLHPAIKAEAIDYLDNNGAFPGRYAKVHVFRPAKYLPDVMEYSVGPLNESVENLVVKQLREDGEIGFNRRPYDVAESTELYNLLNKELEFIESLLLESFGKTGNNTELYPSFSYLPTSNRSDRTSYMVMILNLGKSSTLFTLPVSCTVHHPGSNVSDWYTSDWFYLNQGPYLSSNKLQEAYNDGKVRKIKFPSSYQEDHRQDFSLVRNISLPSRDLSDIPPPRTFEPKGPRYTIKGHRIVWMGWQFEVSSDPVRGPALFDVRFLEQRIAYEISLQDVTLLYSSLTNGHGPLALSDTFYLIGTYSRPISNVDCPKRASILKTTSFLAGSPIEMEAICVFEADGQRPLWRHWSRGLADHYLVIRAPVSLDNYDYSFEWNFFLDGRLQTLVTASGYLYGAFWNPETTLPAANENLTPFGYKLGDYLLGPIHDHTFTFKVDLDILGRANSFKTLNWTAGNNHDVLRSQSNSEGKPEYHYFNHSRYIVSEILEKENSFIVNTTQPKVWTVVNENKANSWGVHKGYQVMPHSNYAEILQEHMILEAWNQLKYQIAVTKRKEGEPYATNSLYDLTHPRSKPIEDVKVKIDHDNVRNEDIVLWISEKFYHLPTSEDVPMTLPAQTGFTLKPFNYFDRTPTFDLPARYTDNEPYDTMPCSEHG